MTDRHAGYVVTLEEDLREDDAEAVVGALRQIRGVASVTPVFGGAQHQVAVERAKWMFLDKLYAFCREVSGMYRP